MLVCYMIIPTLSHSLVKQNPKTDEKRPHINFMCLSSLCDSGLSIGLYLTGL